MAFLQDAAQDLPELLKKMENFASGIGYKIIETDTTDLHKDPCTIHFEIDPIENQTDYITSETVPDRILKMHLLLAPKQEGGAIPIVINDLVGPFPNVWFFSTQNQKSIWVVVQTTEERYTHFGFGAIDKKGMTTPDCAFAVGLYYHFWGQYSFAPANNQVDSSQHEYYFRGDAKTANLFIPDGVLDPKYFPNNYPIIANKMERLLQPQQLRTDFFGDARAGYMIDYYGALKNFTTTGGLPLISIPVLYRQGNNTCWLGELPDFRLVCMDGLEPGEIVKYTDDEWYCFPLKQKGFEQNTHDGITPIVKPNTVGYGIAIRKNTENA